MPFGSDKRSRVIINTDAKNEADDQYAIVHGLLTPTFELHGIVPAHFGSIKSAHSLQDSHDEVMLLLRLMELEGKVTVADGAAGPIPDESTPMPSAGAELIVQEAMKDDPRPLHVAFLGPLTDMASAILMEPRVAQRNLRVVWIGGGYWPVGNREYNLSNDIHAANVVARSGIEIWQIPMKVYRHMAVSLRRALRARLRQGRDRQVPGRAARRLERQDGRPADGAPLARRFPGDRRHDVP